MHIQGDVFNFPQKCSVSLKTMFCARVKLCWQIRATALQCSNIWSLFRIKLLKPEVLETCSKKSYYRYILSVTEHRGKHLKKLQPTKKSVTRNFSSHGFLFSFHINVMSSPGLLLSFEPVAGPAPLFVDILFCSPIVSPYQGENAWSTTQEKQK